MSDQAQTGTPAEWHGAWVILAREVEAIAHLCGLGDHQRRILALGDERWEDRVGRVVKMAHHLDPCPYIEVEHDAELRAVLRRLLEVDIPTMQVRAPSRDNAEEARMILLDKAVLRLNETLGSNVRLIDHAATLRTLAAEIRAHVDPPEVTARTVPVSPDLLQRAAAAVDPGAIDRAVERAAAKAVEAMETRDDPGIGGTDTDWKNVQGRLLAKRDRSEPYTSLRTLANELDCSDATIRKAIDESETLKGWKARSTEPKAAPKATDLGAVVRNNTRQTTEPAPDDVLPDDDVDATMARLIDQAKPDERAKLNALDDAGRRALVATVQAQNLDDEPSPLKPDKPGERPRKVKQHKRA